MAVPSISTAISYPPHQLRSALLYNSGQHFIRLLPLFLNRQSMTITLLSFFETGKQPVLPCQLPLMQMPVLLTAFAAEYLPGLYFWKGFLAVSTSRHPFTSTLPPYHKDIPKDVMDEINSEISSLLTKFVVRSQNTSLLDRKYCRSRIAVNTDTQLSSAGPRPHLHDFQTASRGTNRCAVHCAG